MATPNLPPIAPVNPKAPLPPEVFEPFCAFLAELNGRFRKMAERYDSSASWMHECQFDPAKMPKAFRLLQEGSLKDCLAMNLRTYHMGFPSEMKELVAAFVIRQDFQLIHVLRFLALLRLVEKQDLARGPNASQTYQFYFGERVLDVFRAQSGKSFELRELAGVMEACGVPRTALFYSCTGYQYFNEIPFFQWEDEALWPYFYEHAELMQPYFSGPQQSDYWWKESRLNVLRICSRMASVPEEYVPKLWEIAFGTAKGERSLAQKALEHLPDFATQVMAGLQASAKDSRLAAAEWLGRLRVKPAVPALKTAFAKEKTEAVKGAMLMALERCGESIAVYLNREGLLKEAQTGLKKGIPSGLDGFPFERLPVVHWSDSGTPVESDILTWFLVQGCKQKTAEPGALLRQYGRLMDQAERERLGRFVLETWIERDTEPLYVTEAEIAKAVADLLNQDPWWGEYAEPMIRSKMKSAIGEKGILAVAAAFGGEGLALPVQDYLKTHYGTRAAQCKALIQMLSWTEARSAVQVLLSVANRFRTKGIREEAELCIRQLSERKGWTRDELADRTTPTGGFDASGTLMLDYGPRSFTARLNQEAAIVLTDAAGNGLKSLPEPRKDDDAAKAAEAQALFAEAKKTLKATLPLQKSRLYEAFCGQRGWTCGDWKVFLLGHPLLSRLAIKMLWTAETEGKPAVTFRPLADGSLTNAADEAVELDETAVIRPLFGGFLTDEEVAAWQTHVTDYEVELLFDQLAKPLFRLTEDNRHTFACRDFEGYLMEAFTLRSRALKLGYSRGETEDGGYFFEYQKVLAGLGITVAVQFSGNRLPEENRTVALETLSFFRNAVQKDSTTVRVRNEIQLGKVPPVLLAEAWRDLQSIARMGKGFDPDWQQKIG
ncbi:MAG: DUF4132 domain-containing protein [Blastocatellia bacterium]|nr:DUF4132 domain-containing protein [Blastocatellia bacterium]